jgi:hypothetical protein
MAHSTIREPQYPGLEYDKWSSGERYIGTREKLVEHGLVPADVPFPGDIPGKKGSRFVNAEGRKCSMSKWRPGVFRLDVQFTYEQQAEARHLEEAERNAKKIAAKIERLDITQEDYQQRLVNFLNTMFNELIGMMFRERPTGEEVSGEFPFYYSTSLHGDMAMHYSGIRQLIDHSPIYPDSALSASLKAELAAKSDSSFQSMMARILD